VSAAVRDVIWPFFGPLVEQAVEQAVMKQAGEPIRVLV
jgi:hypothetical protein